tara:strand:- start:977 stop:1816 length:840 start_codon:yes stop_codon:yes gene_type:complete
MIHNAIESVLAQTYKDWELIIVDDESKDNTKAVINKYKKLDNRIRYIYQKNSERSAARNNGIRNSLGEWVCFLDSDDLFYKTHLEEFKKLIKFNNYKKGIYFSGLSNGEFSKELEIYDLSHKNNIEFVLINTFATPQACISRAILSEQKFNEKISIGEDRDLWVRISKNYPVFIHCSKTLIQVNHPNRSVNSINNIKEHIRLNKILISELKIHRSLKNKIISNSYFSLSRLLLEKNMKLRALQIVLISLFINISNKQTKHKIYIIMSLMLFKIPKDYRV